MAAGRAQRALDTEGVYNRPFYVFETGGTTGMPKQRIGWEDHLRDYEEFSETLDENAFPRGGNWLDAGADWALGVFDWLSSISPISGAARATTSTWTLAG
jgi:hypothetical protein